ncbi:uncharacterized protein LY89DRAFT_740874 [Mollisia scopiformis]|uniref:Uncharacterized protein n=1 Tax=Mollisia scopiformis TaxID=149040 RepID=A0A132BBL4_MOLSC|nr:uncharacterized protein LY89DRAFT_740874 [Mollisia scopiformis]KUJ09805.1 hypothetical protein LY89DRAFT_740874 [Mollisia scopiformis]
MSSNAGIPIHGKIDDTHTTLMNAQYAPNNIPTPWPLVVFSLLLSFIICCIGAAAALMSVDPQGMSAKSTSIPLSRISGKRKVTVTSTTTVTAVSYKPRSLPRTIIYYLTVVFCTFRAISAFIIGLKSLQDDTTPLAAPSVILLALISTQIMDCNIGHNPLTRLILELDIIALAISFGMSGYAPNHHEWWPRYSTMKITDGNCPVYAGDCMSQAPHWLSVGCGDWSTPTNYDSGVSYGYPEVFYLPYQNTGDLNVQTGMNTLHATEMTIIVFGSVWWCFVFFHILDIFTTLEDIFKRKPAGTSLGGTSLGGTSLGGTLNQRSIFSSIKSLLAPLSPRARRQPAPRKVATAWQQSYYPLICVLGLFVAFVVMLMSIGAHASQMMKKQQTTYLESFGPQVGTNFTTDGNGVITGSDYWGNATSWSDCFVVRAPGSRNGFWSEWVESNRRGGALFRIAAGM